MITVTQSPKPKSLGCLFVCQEVPTVLCCLPVPAVGSCANQQKDAAQFCCCCCCCCASEDQHKDYYYYLPCGTLLLVCLCRRIPDRVQEEWVRERERERERDPEPASSSSTPQHLTIYLSNDLVVCRAAYAAVVVVEEK